MRALLRCPPPLQLPSKAVAEAAVCLPEELASWLASLELSEHGVQLVADHKLRFVQDCRVLDREDLIRSGLVKVEAERFLKAAAMLRGESMRISGLTGAWAEDGSSSPHGPRARASHRCRRLHHATERTWAAGQRGG